MPAVVLADIEGRSPGTVRELQLELAATYRADFATYSGRMNRDIIDAALLAASSAIGQKFTYSRVGDGVKHQQAKRAIELLSQARVCHLVRRTAATAIPLRADATDRSRKVILGDAGFRMRWWERPRRTPSPPGVG